MCSLVCHKSLAILFLHFLRLCFNEMLRQCGLLAFFLQSSDRKKCLSPTFINHQRVLLCVHHLYRYMHRSLIDDTEFCADVETLAREVGSPRHADDLRPYQSRSGASRHQGGRVFCATQLAHVPPSRAGSQTGWPTREPGRCTMA